jgi:hypothetical protein
MQRWAAAAKRPQERGGAMAATIQARLGALELHAVREAERLARSGRTLTDAELWEVLAGWEVNGWLVLADGRWSAGADCPADVSAAAVAVVFNRAEATEIGGSDGKT